MYVSPHTAETSVGASPTRTCGGRGLEHGDRMERTQIVGSGCLRAVSAPGQGRAHGVLRPIPPRSGGIRAAAPGKAHVSFVTVKKPRLRLKKPHSIQRTYTLSGYKTGIEPDSCRQHQGGRHTRRIRPRAPGQPGSHPKRPPFCCLHVYYIPPLPQFHGKKAANSVPAHQKQITTARFLFVFH